MEGKLKIGVVDIGSNSIVLLIATINDNQTISPLNEFYTITKLGAEVKKNGCLSDDAVNYAINTVMEMKLIAQKEGVSDLIVTASSAVRNAENRNRFLVKCHQKFGIFPQVLSGKEEAQYTFLGATADLYTENTLFSFDIGGGSTEICWGTKNLMASGESLEIGCVNIAELFNITEDISMYKRMAAGRYIRKQLQPIVEKYQNWASSTNPEVIATGGTVTTFAAIHLKQAVYDRLNIHEVKCTRKDVAQMSKEIAKMDLKNRRRLPGMEKDRAEEMPAGLLILTEILRSFNFQEFIVSTNGLRVGILKNYASRIKH
jgi:exopolyphosphatase/guanosine-5'-triphosphate,3'-diphosphate pyrophosphatase